MRPMRNDCTGTGAGELSEAEDALGDKVKLAEAKAKLEVESLALTLCSSSSFMTSAPDESGLAGVSRLSCSRAAGGGCLSKSSSGEGKRWSVGQAQHARTSCVGLGCAQTGAVAVAGGASSLTERAGEEGAAIGDVAA